MHTFFLFSFFLFALHRCRTPTVRLSWERILLLTVFCASAYASSAIALSRFSYHICQPLFCMGVHVFF
uniref:Putative secreted protein n=1 Tax=Anopheles triannulatus TaxID=58253 RepID=A0A2M4B2Y1_9DIPT